MASFLDKLWQKFSLSDDLVELEEYHTTWLLRLCRRIEETVTLFLIKIPPFYEAFVESDDKRKYLKMFIQFLFGVFLGFLFYRIILVDLQLDRTSTTILGVIIMLCLGVGNVVSSQMRCISFLLPIQFGSSIGRSVLISLIIIYVIAGPISNIAANLNESVRVILCQMGTTFSLVKTKYELMFKPLREAFLKLKSNPEETREMLSSVDEAVQPLRNEFENDTEVKNIKRENDYIDDKAGETRRSQDIENRYRILDTDDASQKIEKTYMKKLEYRCESIASKTLSNCRQVFVNSYDQCVHKLHWSISWLCYVVRLTFICNFFSLFGGSNFCHSNRVVLPGVGRTYQFLNESREKLKAEFHDFHFYYKFIDVPLETKETLDNMYDAGKTIIKEFKEKKSMIEVYVLIFLRITAFSFLSVIIQCNNYIFNYLNDIEEDNNYITSYFRKIDYRRFVKGKFTLLPLKTYEKRELTDVYEFYLTNDDKGELWYSLITAIILFFFSVIFIIIDHFLYNLLLDLKTYGFIQYNQVGHHDMSLEIRGVGFMASVLRSLANAFTIKRKIKRIVTNEECLPKPSIPGTYDFKIFTSFFLLLLLSITNPWILKRLNRYVCSIFYPKAEKRRIIYLYNECLKKRITYLNYKLDIVKKDQKEEKHDDQLTFYLTLRLKYPRIFGWLTYLNVSRRKCLICEEEEPKKGGKSHCANIQCYVYFDDQCWNFVVKQQCIGCSKAIKETALNV